MSHTPRCVRTPPATPRPILSIQSGLVATDGNRYREAREAAGLTRDQLAARARVSTKTVQRLEDGTGKVGGRLRQAIEVQLGMEPEDVAHATTGGPRVRSITEFSDPELVADLLRRLNEGRRGLRAVGPADHTDPDSHTDVEDGPALGGGLTSSG